MNRAWIREQKAKRAGWAKVIIKAHAADTGEEVARFKAKGDAHTYAQQLARRFCEETTIIIEA